MPRPSAPRLKALLDAAHRREFDTLLIWALDRLSREGIGPMVRTIEQLPVAGVRVLSHQEPLARHRRAVARVFAWVAQQERERIAERVRAGITRARAQDVRLGRPRRAVDVSAVRERRPGASWR